MISWQAARGNNSSCFPFTTVRLHDFSRQNVAATRIAEQVLVTAGEQVPVPFTLPCAPAQIDDRFSDSVSARIEVERTPTWISDTLIPVNSRGAPTDNVKVMVVSVQ